MRIIKRFLSNPSGIVAETRLPATPHNYLVQSRQSRLGSGEWNFCGLRAIITFFRDFTDTRRDQKEAMP
jgi:hypothetical protein